MLTPRLLRLEYEPDGIFEDRASMVFWQRRLPVPQFAVSENETHLEIITEHLRLWYRKGQPFTADTLSIEVNTTGSIWHYGDKDPENLGGTVRTLDQVWQKIALDQGLISRSGWAVIDDSHSLMLDEQGWIAPRARARALDLYFFGHDMTIRLAYKSFVWLLGKFRLCRAGHRATGGAATGSTAPQTCKP
jgi:hypothetical protein